MIIGGFQKFSLLDYPDQISAIVFTQGCNFRCSYCHNKELLEKEPSNSTIDPQEIWDFLNKRWKQIDAVVITGGEPTIQPDLIEFMQKIKALGFLVKLDTNGSNPEVIEEIIKLKLADYIAMDIKAPLEKYQDITNSGIDTEKIEKSINLIKNSGIKYEFRTTILKTQLSKDDILQIKDLANGARLWFLQKYIPSKNLSNNSQNELNYSNDEFETLLKSIKTSVLECFIR
ncbi:MAG: anaerobic ribonucleoside-triphosphate reductase activating protein [Candidatus Melainabacteria bacterium GWA2_34_9]|nr:MAG: anaerobic ribonucleoside-triphosphate reductase activating protein [Candidatus Melainabacteria bacterium GWA2_34_9]